VRRLDFTRCEEARGGQALAYIAARLSPWGRPELMRVAQSVQQGVVDFGYRAGMERPLPPAVAWFHRQLIARAPALAFDRPPTES
jgi:hypothetical protein